jgi:hypothetical protein
MRWPACYSRPDPRDRGDRPALVADGASRLSYRELAGRRPLWRAGCGPAGYGAAT